MNNWTLHVENFGKIRKADIEVSPFTLFVGDNNSGKSYIMSLIYGLLTLDFNSEKFYIDEQSENYKVLINYYKENFNSKNKTIKIDENIFNYFIMMLNEFLQDNKTEIIKQIFNININIDVLNVKIPYDDNFFIGMECLPDNDNTYFVYSSYKKEKVFTNAAIRENNFFKKIMDIMLKGLPFATNNSLHYLPTSRTGFVLTYKMLVEKSIKTVFSNSDTNNTILTKPYIDFLSDLSTLSNQNNTDYYDDIIKFVEKNIMNGSVKLNNDLPISDLTYTPYKSNDNLPMFISSAVVTEITPLILLLKYHKYNYLGFMIEEPEMCLHLKLQRFLTRVFIKLINKGVPIFITTHSDTIFQHINNMIKLSKNPNKDNLMKEFDYQEDDLINPDDIRVYQFDVLNERTEVKKLECEEYGFTIPTFNETLFSMLEEINNFQMEEE